MNKEPDRMIRRLLSGEQIPYPLLLLADETTEAIERYIHESDVYVIENEERFIAVYVLQPVDSSVVEIKNIAVDRDYQGMGIGHSLLSDAIRRAKEMGYSEIIIGTGDIAVRQISLYESVGFKKYGIKKDFYVRNYPDPICENGVQLRDMVMLKIVL
jgi:ribosomal protein S18 acetylase RimI-like enzyme